MTSWSVRKVVESAELTSAELIRMSTKIGMFVINSVSRRFLLRLPFSTIEFEHFPIYGLTMKMTSERSELVLDRR